MWRQTPNYLLNFLYYTTKNSAKECLWKYLQEIMKELQALTICVPHVRSNSSKIHYTCQIHTCTYTIHICKCPFQSPGVLLPMKETRVYTKSFFKPESPFQFSDEHWARIIELLILTFARGNPLSSEALFMLPECQKTNCEFNGQYPK